VIDAVGNTVQRLGREFGGSGIARLCRFMQRRLRSLTRGPYKSAQRRGVQREMWRLSFVLEGWEHAIPL